ncbi:ClC family H(+)/Cl(-) exchange transporter [Streptococcus sciuri]|uniref:ClC family H(+)/Cl(-) exchange transporter n=1 Tax=Streptococcus sciuri TaxID=2973939 RepID=A0ABT2F5K0_9STRE|nr:ClC family H(+)/Cl(-) exchange transporter [Streptococcus sciuri]MCS4487712.1 ClC family H(+)/Cl(-) exchange transporter [Streptococcus sciuri]
MERHKQDYQLSSESILRPVYRGVLVGLLVGILVGVFRLLIEKLLTQVRTLYQESHDKPYILIVIIAFSLTVALIVAFLIKSDPNIKGSGIPHVEGELKGLLHPNWCSVAWRKFLGGVLAISSGLMLGREGPSIQLGAMAGKGLSELMKAGRTEQRILIASGAAAGLSAAFNAPIAGLLFVVEEVYHHFSRMVWITALVASLVANFISLNIFGLNPVLAMPKKLAFLELHQYWIYLLLGLLLGISGYIYEKAVLNIGRCYTILGKICHLPAPFYVVLAMLFLFPIGYFFPQLLGGGNSLIVSLPSSSVGIWTAFLYLVIRFVWSMLSYGSGVPGGIFLPILTLGALSGMVFGLGIVELGIISRQFLPLFVTLGMAGYFGAVSKAPLTAMILVTEMVGDLRQLMALGIVTLVAYLVMDLLKGEPIYEAMLDKMSPKKATSVVEPTLIELTVSEKMAGKRVKDLLLPKNVLITTQLHTGEAEVVSGDTVLQVGDTIFLVVNEPEIGAVRAYFMS